MADKKITQLTSATALAGTEVTPVVQGGITKKATIDQILAPAAGKGIDFSANGGDVLTQYDEGTWTPTFAGWTSAPTVYNATYTRIGRQVTLTMYASEGVNNYAGIGGIPFTGSASSTGAGVIANRTDHTSAGTCCVFTSGTTIDSFNVTLTGKFWQLIVTYFV